MLVIIVAVFDFAAEWMFSHEPGLNYEVVRNYHLALLGLTVPFPRTRDAAELCFGRIDRVCHLEIAEEAHLNV
jgi:hypothetical protein